MVTIGDTPVDMRYGAPGPATHLRLEKINAAAFNELSAAIHEGGAVASFELNHPGRMANQKRNLNGEAPIGPMEWDRPDGVHVQAATLEQLEYTADQYAAAAAFLKQCGFDMCILHGGHGWLLGQFLSPATNQRTDEFGGSRENRARFPLMVIERVRERVGADFLIDYRISGDELQENGQTIEDTIAFIKAAEDKLDMVHISAGLDTNMHQAIITHPHSYLPRGVNVKYAAAVKAAGVKIPVTTVGAINTPDQAEQILVEGKADCIAMCRAQIADPHWANKARLGRADEIRPCIRCHNACFTMARYEGTANIQDLGDAIHMARCALNPTTMQTKKYRIVKTEKPKRIAIIGGGIGGMESALVLAERGHQPTIFEKSDILAAAPSYKESDRQLIEWYRRKVAQAGIPVKLNTEVKCPDELTGFDEIIIATGSSPRRLPVPGIERAMEATEYLSGRDVGENVIIIGGGLTGCEIAYDLILKGKKPQIVEMKNDLIAVKGVCLANSSFLREMLAFKKTPVYLNTSLVSINEDGVTVKGQDGNTFDLKGDSVIVSVGYKPAPLSEKRAHVHLVGDANGVGNLRTVIWRAWDVCMKL